MAVKSKVSKEWDTDYWCPSRQRFVFCEDPCPDGRAHVKRSRWVEMTFYYSDIGDPEELKQHMQERRERIRANAQSD